MVDVNVRESEDLRGASISNYAELGGLPDAETIHGEIEAETIRKFARVFNMDESEVREFAEQ